MIIPTVRIVISDDHCCFPPLGPHLQGIDDPDEEVLFIERIGISGMTILEGRCLQEADRR